MVIRSLTQCGFRFLKLHSKEVRRCLSTKRSRHCLISCKRKEYDHYLDTYYSSLESVSLATKGWHHNKAKGDFFMINPIPSDYKSEMELFSKINVHPEIIKVLKNEGIKKATSFQLEAIPKVNKGNHVMIGAETGCGKTICYLIPIIQSLIGGGSDQMNTPRALILVPNRELAYQVGEIAQLLSLPVNVKVKIIVGGKTKKAMINPNFEDIDIIVATPGAIGKLASVGLYRLQNVQHTVLDEADTLTDDSFEERISGIIRKVPQSRIILVSATIPKSLPDVLEPIESILEHIISPGVHKPLLNTTQKFLRLTKSEKPFNLLTIAKANKDPMIVFTNKNETCNWLAMFLREHNISCSNINGDMNYALRIEQWNNFLKGESKILSSTDVGSRGLDTTQVRHVLNYDFPLYAADYLHRVGRVGRLGCSHSSRVTNFVSNYPEVQLAQQIELAIRTKQPLQNVDGNISGIVQKKIQRKIRDVA